MVHTQNVLHQVIGLTNQLHVAILNPIMDHFHKMTCALISNLKTAGEGQIIVRLHDNKPNVHNPNYATHPVTTRLPCSDLSSDALEDVFNVRP